MSIEFKSLHDVESKLRILGYDKCDYPKGKNFQDFCDYVWQKYEILNMQFKSEKEYFERVLDYFDFAFSSYIQ